MNKRKIQKWQLALCILLFCAAGIAFYCNREVIWPPDDSAEQKRMAEGKAAVGANNVFPQPGQGKTTHSKTPVLRAARPVFPATPAVALLDFQADTDSYLENLAARQFTDVVQAELGNMPSLRWVERQRLKLAIDELNLSALSVESGAMQLRLGKWLKADLVVRGAFCDLGKPSSHLRLEVIDLATGDLAAERQVPIRLASLGGKLSQTEAIAVAAAAREAITESVKWLTSQRGSRTVAALFFRNLSATDRLDYFEDQLLRAMSNIARQLGGVRVLRFPRPALAREEAELAMLGLTDGNPDVWQHVGDLYLWGSYRELNISEATTVPFEQVDVELAIEAWDGLNPPTMLKETAKVADLPAAQQRLTRRVLELASQQSNSMISLGARDELLDLLRARADETYQNLQSASGGNAPQSIWYKHGRQYAAHLLEVACFLAPTSRDARVMMRRKWNYSAMQDNWTNLWNRIDAQERLMSMPIPQSQARRTQTMLSEARGYGTLLEQALRLMQEWPRKLPADLPEPVFREWRDAIARRAISVGQRCQNLLSNEEDQRVSAYTGQGLLTPLLQLPGDPNLTVQAFESWWPILKPGYGGTALNGTRHFISGHEDSILRAYLAAAKPDAIEKLFTFAPGEAGADQIDNTPSRSATMLKERPKSFAELQVPQRQPGKPELVPVVVDVSNLQPPLRPLDVELAAPGRSDLWTRRIGVSGLGWAAGRLWIGTAGGPGDPAINGPALLVYEPAVDSCVRLSPRLGQHSAVTGVVVRNGFVWISTEADGLFRVDARSLDVRKFGGEQGLLSRRVKNLAKAGDKLFVSTGTPKLSVMSGDDGRFTDLDPGGQIATGAAVSSTSLAGHGPWLVFGTARPMLLDTRSGQVRLLSAALADGGVAPRAIDRFAADEAAIWVAADGDLLRYQPDQRKAKKIIIPRAQGNIKPPDLLLADGDYAWMVYWHAYGAYNMENSPKSFVLLFHAASERCVGMFRVNGRVQAMCASPERLWLGCTERAGNVVEVDKLACYRKAGLTMAVAQSGEAPVPAESAAGMTPLMRQAYLGNLSGVREILAGGADVNAATPTGWTALMSAAAGGHPEVVRELLARGARPDAARRQSPKVTALDVAARIGDAEAVKALLQGGVKSRETPGDAEPTLWVAVASGQVGAVEALVEHGTPVMPREDREVPNHRSPLLIAIDLNHRDIIRLLAKHGGPSIWEGGRPLDAAASSGDVQLTEELLRLGADPRQRHFAVESALAWPVSTSDSEMVKLLLRHGADPNTMMLAAEGRQSVLGHACGRGNIEIARLLAKAGADVNRVERSTMSDLSSNRRQLILNTPLTHAAASGNGQAMQVLLELGADLKRDIQGVRHGDLALIRAASKGQFGIVSVLMHMGYNINAKDHNGETALMTVAESDRPEVIQGLLELGADPSITGPNGQTVMTSARSDRVRLVLRNAAGPSTRPASGPRVAPWLAGKHLARAAAAGDVMGVGRALTEGADPNSKNLDGWPAIVLAAGNGHTPVVQALLTAKARVDEPGVEGWTALMQAARGGHIQTVELLLKAGAEMQLVTSIGKTAHDIAAQHGRSNVVAVLEKAGAMKEGRRLIKATYQADPILVRRLLREGVPVDGVDAEGRTALFYALDGRNKPYRYGFAYMFKPNMEIVNALLEHGANVNHQDKRGYTPGMVMFTATEYHPTAGLVRLLLSRGADPKIRGADGRTMLDLCLRLPDVQVHQDLVEMLREAERRTN